jgi:betaine reductase
MDFPVVKAVSCVLAHVPGLVRHGSKPSREIGRQPEVVHQIQTGLRGYEQAVAYAPNQAFIGNVAPEALWDYPQPWWRNGLAGAQAQGRYGEILPEDAFFALLKLADDFHLVHLERGYLERAAERLSAHPLWADADLSRLGEGESADEVAGRARSGEALPLHAGDGALVGYVVAGHEEDVSQAPDILLENLAAKASGALALKHLLRQAGQEPAEVEYLLGCGEEAVGDRYQRGGGSLSKAMAEMAGFSRATGADVKAFCCAPVHSLTVAGALAQASVYRNIVVVGGGSLAKLGMKFRGHLAKDMPVLEDCLASIAVLVGPPDGDNPRLRLDVVGRHTVASGGSARAIYEALLVEPFARAGLRILDVDRYAVELHNPEITEPAGSGNVPKTNYRTIASLGVLLGQLERADIDTFERRHGMPGFSPTQGHIPAALPYLAHARDRLREGAIQRAFFIAKGSLFLGKMTQLADGMSVLVEKSE